MTLPAFRYHPDPVRSGSVVASDDPCACCGQARGYLYAGPLYGEETEARVCPWCIADGTAHESLGAEFVDSEAFAADTPDAVVTEIVE